MEKERGIKKEGTEIQIDLRPIDEVAPSKPIESSDYRNTSTAAEVSGDVELSEVQRENLAGTHFGKYDPLAPAEERRVAILEVVESYGSENIPDDMRLDMLTALKKIKEYDFNEIIRQIAMGIEASLELGGNFAPFIEENKRQVEIWEKQKAENEKKLAEQKESGTNTKVEPKEDDDGLGYGQYL